MSKRASSSVSSRAQGSSTAEPARIELTPAQVDTVVRAATGTGNMSVLLAGLTNARQTLEENRHLVEDPRMSRSLLLGLLVLSGFPSDRAEIGVIDLAHQLGLGESTTYRYTATLLSVGLLERDPSTRRYKLSR
jgi:hypothetical protein